MKIVTSSQYGAPKKGYKVKAGDQIGTAENLDVNPAYKGITPHMHLEVRDSNTPANNGKYGFKGYMPVDPTGLLP